MSERPLAEHDAFRILTESLERAAFAAKAIALHRPDTAYKWVKMAETFEVSKQAVWHLAGDGFRK